MALERMRTRRPPPNRIVLLADRAGLAVLVTLGLVLGLGYAARGVVPVDPDTFWQAGHSMTYYGTTWGADARSFYVYPPPLAQILGIIPWPPFIVGWMTLLGFAFWVATRWWSLVVLGVGTAAIVAFGFNGPLVDPIRLTIIGNPQIVIAAVCVVGFSYPATWAFPILTKIGPGIALLWFVARAEWRALAHGLGATVAVAAISFVAAPGQWAEFLRFASANAGAASPEAVVPIPFIVRLPMAAALILWGAKTDRRWTVPIAVGWSAIALYEWTYVTVWIAALPLAFGSVVRAEQVMAPGRQPIDEAGSIQDAGGRP